MARVSQTITRARWAQDNSNEGELNAMPEILVEWTLGSLLPDH